ncbi:MAG: hypothetical protein AAGA56_20945 [Myxococcota bacterium]
MLGEIQSTWPGAAPRVLPLVRELEYYDGFGIAWSHVAPDLGTHQAFLGIGTLKSIGDDHYARWRIDFEEVLRVALDNLERDFFPEPFAAYDGLFILESDSLAPSFMLLPEELTSMDDGDLIAWPTSRDVLMLTNSESEPGLAQLRSIMSSYDGGRMTDWAFRWGERGWEPEFLAGQPSPDSATRAAAALDHARVAGEVADQITTHLKPSPSHSR